MHDKGVKCTPRNLVNISGNFAWISQEFAGIPEESQEKRCFPVFGHLGPVLSSFYAENAEKSVIEFSSQEGGRYGRFSTSASDL